jgi:creatinine amidohydrolase
MAWWISGPKLCPQGTFGEDYGIGHAGEAETSTALYLVPDLVDMDIARGEWPQSPSEVKLFTTIPETSKTGATGDPKNATSDKGQQILEHLSDYLSRFLMEMDRTDWNFVRDDWAFLDK